MTHSFFSDINVYTDWMLRLWRVELSCDDIDQAFAVSPSHEFLADYTNVLYKVFFRKHKPDQPKHDFSITFTTEEREKKSNPLVNTY